MRFSVQKIKKTINKKWSSEARACWNINPDRLTHKKYSRCFVSKASDVEKVEKILKEISEFEFYYMPSSWVQVFEGNYEAIKYHGKFNPKMPSLYAKCKEKGIEILVVECTDSDLF